MSRPTIFSSQNPILNTSVKKINRKRAETTIKNQNLIQKSENSIFKQQNSEYREEIQQPSQNQKILQRNQSQQQTKLKRQFYAQNNSSINFKRNISVQNLTNNNNYTYKLNFNFQDQNNTNLNENDDKNTKLQIKLNDIDQNQIKFFKEKPVNKNLQFSEINYQNLLNQRKNNNNLDTICQQHNQFGKQQQKSYAELDGKNLHFINLNNNSRDFYVEQTFKKVKQDYSHSYIKQNEENQLLKRQKNRSTANLFSSSCQGYYDTTNSEYKLINYQSTNNLFPPKKQVSRSISNYNFNSTNSQHKQKYQNQRSLSVFQNNYNNNCNLKSEKTIYEQLLAQKQKNNQDFYVNHPRSNKNYYNSKDINYLNSQKMVISLQDISYTNKAKNLDDQLLSQKYYQNSRNYKNYNNNDHIAPLINQQDANKENILQQKQIQVQNQLQNLRIMNPIVDYQVTEKKNICDNYNHKKHFKIQDNVSLCLNKSENQNFIQNQSKKYERNKENQSLSQQIIQKQKNSQNWPYDPKINNNQNRSLYKTEKNKTKIDGRNFYIY